MGSTQVNEIIQSLNGQFCFKSEQVLFVPTQPGKNKDIQLGVITYITGNAFISQCI